METLAYLILAALVYGFIADRSARVVEREMRARRAYSASHLRLVDDVEVRPDHRS